MQLPPHFGIRELAELARERGLFDLAQGIIESPPPAALTEAFTQVQLSTSSRYNNKRGVLAYREALCRYLASRGWDVSVDRLMGTAGIMGATVGALLADCRPGDSVVLPEPFFIGHKIMLESLGFSVTYLPSPLDAQPDWDVLEATLQSARAVLLTTPANPTGQVASPDVLRHLCSRASETGCLLLIDETYREFIWDTSSPTDDAPYADLDLTHAVVMRSFSKTFSIPGWRVGFAITSPERIERMAMHHDALYIGGSTIAQHGVAFALSEYLPELNDSVVQLRSHLEHNRDMLAAAFRAYGMEPLPVPATYYMILKHNRASDRAALEELIEKKIVATPVNILFSDSSRDTGYIRIHFGVLPETAQGVVAALSA